jgi:hypothetical protein
MEGEATLMRLHKEINQAEDLRRKDNKDGLDV